MKDLKNNLLKRREVQLVVSAEKNPGLGGASKIMSDNFKVGEENIVIKKIKGKFGRDTFLIDALIYNSVKDKEMVEPKIRVKKSAEVGK